jgi:hypothetical protein
MFIKFIKQQLGLEVIPEYRFNPGRKWKSDYYIPSLRLLIEQEGGIYTGQAHGSIKGILRDIEKYNSATLLGYRVLRYPPDKLYTTQTLEDIKTLIKLTR